MAVQISKVNLLNLLSMVPKKLIKSVVISVEGENLAIIGRSATESKILYHFYSPLTKASKTEEFAIDALKLASKVNSIRDDIIVLSYKDGLLTITGKEAKDKSYKLTTENVDSCISFINYQSENTLKVSVEKGKLVKEFTNDPSRNETILFNKEVPISAQLKEEIYKELSENKGSFILIDFKPNISTFYAEDGETNTFTKIDFQIPIDFSFSYLTDPIGLKAIIKLFKDDFSLMLSDNRPALSQLYGQGNSIILSSPKLSESVQEFINRCKTEE